MPTADRYRLFARKCIGWADRAKTIEHREILLDMATRWEEAAAWLERQRALRDKFGEIASEAQRWLLGLSEAAVSDGNGRPNGMERQPKKAGGVSIVNERQLPRETPAE